MKRTILLVLIALVIAGNAEATFIAGSTNDSPPPFWKNSYWGFSTMVEHAFPFTIDLDGQYALDSLEVAVFQNTGSSAAASFTIRPDVAGLPGETVLDTFNIMNISTVQQIMTGEASQQAILSSGVNYWIVARASKGSVSWNLSAGGMSPSASRIVGDDWTYRDRTNVCTFAIHGTSVPEPATMTLLGLGGLLIKRRTRNS